MSLPETPSTAVADPGLDRDGLRGQLAAALRRQRSLFDTSAVGIAELDGEYRVTAANACLGVMLGVEPDRLIGCRANAFLQEWDTRQPAGYRLAAAIDARGERQRDWQMRLHGGPVRWCQISVRPLDPQDPARGLTLVMVDSEQRRRAEREQRSARFAAAQAAGDYERFLAMASHELRSPLHVMLGLAQLLEHEGDAARRSELLRDLRRDGLELLRRIELLQDLSRRTSGHLPIQNRPCALHALLDEALAGVQRFGEAKGLRLRTQFAPTLPAQVLLDPQRLAQALSILLDNAVKFTTHGSVWLRARAWARGPGRGAPPRVTLVLEVADTGSGIPRAYRADIFEAFVQAPVGAGRRRGSGLGLAVCQRLVTAMGGRIELASRVGVGSRFRVVLPDTAVLSRAAAPAVAVRTSAAVVVQARSAPLTRYADAPLPPRLAAALAGTPAARWCALDPADPPALVTFAADMRRLAATHGAPALDDWAAALAAAACAPAEDQRRALLHAFARFVLCPPPHAALLELRALADLGLTLRIEDWCDAWDKVACGCGPFVGAVRSLAYTFDAERLLLWVDAFLETTNQPLQPG